jgi:hypothetical protein
MIKPSNMFRRVGGVGVVWATLWLVFWVVIAAVIAIVDPDSMDPGEPLGMLAIFAPMGLFSGLAFAGLLFRFAPARPSLLQASALGVLGTGVVQLAYLGHGDQGLLANLLMAFLFALVGGLVTMAWYATTRVMPHSRFPLVHS